VQQFWLWTDVETNMYRQFPNDYYDLAEGPHRMKLLEHDLGLSEKPWIVRAAFKAGVVLMPILLIAAVGMILHLTA